jgi:hypothetical protein
MKLVESSVRPDSNSSSEDRDEAEDVNPAGFDSAENADLEGSANFHGILENTSSESDEGDDRCGEDDEDNETIVQAVAGDLHSIVRRLENRHWTLITPTRAYDLHRIEGSRNFRIRRGKSLADLAVNAGRVPLKDHVEASIGYTYLSHGDIKNIIRTESRFISFSSF